MKVCTKCKRELPAADSFGRDASRKDGLHPICKACKVRLTMLWKAANPDKVKANARQWRANVKARKALE